MEHKQAKKGTPSQPCLGNNSD